MIKNKLKQRELNKKGDINTDPDDWPVRLIKLLISFFSKNFHEITNNIDDLSKWAPLASDIGKSEAICKEKFIELRKSYRKLKTMRTRNPDVKISWIYFDLFDKIYTARESEYDSMEVETLEEQVLMEEEVTGWYFIFLLVFFIINLFTWVHNLLEEFISTGKRAPFSTFFKKCPQ